jgi:hypothetical protein
VRKYINIKPRPDKGKDKDKHDDKDHDKTQQQRRDKTRVETQDGRQGTGREYRQDVKHGVFRHRTIYVPKALENQKKNKGKLKDKIKGEHNKDKVCLCLFYLTRQERQVPLATQNRTKIQFERQDRDPLAGQSQTKQDKTRQHTE